MFTLLTQRLTPLLDRLGNWNPQLLREWKGRLKPLPVVLALALSLLMQVGLIFSFGLMLPQSVDFHDLSTTTNPEVEFDVIDNDLIISQLNPVSVVVGQSSSEVPQSINPGDQVVSINNQPVPDLATFPANTSPYALTTWADTRLGKSKSISKEQFQGQVSLGSPISLGLYNSVTHYSYQVSLPIVGASYYRNPFCITLSQDHPICRVNSDQRTYQINWVRWYFTIFITTTVILVLALSALGGFMIFNDLSQEQRRGTLNFVRMSPRSPLSIVLGKILGVPAPLYLGVLAALPFHYGLGLAAGFSPVGLLAFYLIFSAQLLVFYSGGFLLTLVYFGVVNFHAWIYTALGLGIGFLATSITLVYNLGNYHTNPYPSFVFLSLVFLSPAMPLLYALQSSPVLDSLDLDLSIQLYMGGQPVSQVGYFLISLLGSALILTIVSKVIDRKFQNPGTTWMPRRYSYGMTIVTHLGLLLFAIPNAVIQDDSLSNGRDWIFINAVILFIFTSLYLALLTYALTPSRQLFLDWLRFQGKTTAIRHWTTPLLVDRSSPLPALICNFVLGEVLILAWLVFVINDLTIEVEDGIGVILCCLGLFSGVVILLLLMSQIVLISPFKNPQIWLTYSVLGTIAAHVGFMTISYVYFKQIASTNLALLTMLSTLFLQCLGILGLRSFYQRQLRHAAQSEWQELLAGEQGRMPQTL